MAPTLPRNAQEASACIDKALNLATRAFMANRGVWEPIYIHGPSISFAHTADDVDRYLDRLDEWLHCLLESRS